VAILTLLNAAVLMIGRERFDAIEAMAKQTIFSPFNRMGNFGPATVSLSLGHLCHLVAK
jgi:hypothetical protein